MASSSGSIWSWMKCQGPILRGSSWAHTTSASFEYAFKISAAWSAAMTVGTNGVCSSQWFMVQRQVTPVNIGASLVIVGTANATVEYTHNDPNALPAGATVPTVWPLAALASKTSSTDGVAGITWPVVAYRVTLNSGTGSARMDAVQAGVWS